MGAQTKWSHHLGGVCGWPLQLGHPGYGSRFSRRVALPWHLIAGPFDWLSEEAGTCHVG
jgi:hypothetical protein